jgi:hypothetical protein
LYAECTQTKANSTKRLSKQNSNRFGLPAQQYALPRESLARVNVLPKDAPQEIIDKYGPNSAFGQGDGQVPKEMPPPPKPKRQLKQKSGPNQAVGHETLNGKAETQSTNKGGPLEELASLLNPLNEMDIWATHPPVPDVCDLIGYVTSGGYNLSEGKGTAVGSIWTQRLLQGWTTSETDQRLRRLCIVRNAGEQFGRLGMWELCGM